MSERVQEVEALLEALKQANPAFTPKEEEFVQNMQDLLDRWGFKMFVSDGRLFWLRDIKGKYVDGIAPAPRPRNTRSQYRSDAENREHILRKQQQQALEDDDIPF